MLELIYNKWFLVAAGVLVALVLYRFLNRNKTADMAENEYSEILNSDKYKVKGQYD